MGNQNLVLLVIGVFVSLIVAAAAVDQYLLDEHPETEVAGLIWRVENALSQVTDLEAVLELTDESRSDSIRLLVRYLSGSDSALSVRYLYPEILRDEIFTVERDLLSHYLPRENLTVVKRWVGLPLTQIALAGFDLSQLETRWRAGQVSMQVLQDVPGFAADLFPSSLSLSETIAGVVSVSDFSLCSTDPPAINSELSLAATSGSLDAGSSIRGGFILEVRDVPSGQLSRMIWIERETYMIERIVFFVDGQRSASIRVQRMTLDQGLAPEDILTLPRDVDVIRG